MSSAALLEREAPSALTMERLGDTNELIVAQSTSQCCRCACFQPSINWVINESNNFTPGTNPHDLPHSGWVHEESTWCMRTMSCFLPGCRKTKYVQHSGSVPDSILEENKRWFRCQNKDKTAGLSEEERNKDVIATHEKGQTCGQCCWCPPYLETKHADGRIAGKTQYVCDVCLFVPKFDILDANGERKYRIRPDTCVLGLCVMCRCGGPKGKCCSVPFVVRHPMTMEELTTSASRDSNAQVTQLWSGWANELFMKKNAYHVCFPANATEDEKLTLIGSSILLDIVLFEQDDQGGG
eukprot:CAMPEP_0195521676 /NCGR_PEP_ID=MMETSP0794_2-20130614/19156_1 /TAXON_ID=515487 /ORGANISM="Stephanopyxis turris, Strain CCMP 815" /LENGTH=295 /DNA_ID=CAMNT_0040651285 /DNA_START=168 /DNA_END=1051 /DNA_ORIENTATION=-